MRKGKLSDKEFDRQYRRLHAAVGERLDQTLVIGSVIRTIMIVVMMIMGGPIMVMMMQRRMNLRQMSHEARRQQAGPHPKGKSHLQPDCQTRSHYCKRTAISLIGIATSSRIADSSHLRSGLQAQ